jgi:hypothetical protein
MFINEDLADKNLLRDIFGTYNLSDIVANKQNKLIDEDNLYSNSANNINEKIANLLKELRA